MSGKMRAMGRRGGEATKARMADDPGYYSRIGRLGGKAQKSRTQIHREAIVAKFFVKTPRQQVADELNG